MTGADPVRMAGQRQVKLVRRVTVVFLIICGLGFIWAGPASGSATAQSATGSPADPADDPADDEARFVELVNELRGQHGLVPLRVHAELRTQALVWTMVMADGDQLAHAGDITEGITAPWVTLGENVGVHRRRSVEDLFDAFVASPGHYENLVDPRYQYIGVGVRYGEDGALWTTHRFMAVVDQAEQPGDGPSSSQPPPALAHTAGLPPVHPYLTLDTMLIG